MDPSEIIRNDCVLEIRRPYSPWYIDLRGSHALPRWLWISSKPIHHRYLPRMINSGFSESVKLDYKSIGDGVPHS